MHTEVRETWLLTARSFTAGRWTVNPSRNKVRSKKFEIHDR